MQVSPWIPLAAVGIQAASQFVGQLSTDARGFLDLLSSGGESEAGKLELNLKGGEDEFHSIANASNDDAARHSDSVSDILKKIANRLQAAGIPETGEIEIDFTEDGDYRVSTASTNSIDVTNVLHFDEKLREDIAKLLDGNSGIISRSAEGDWNLAGL